jgi:hypothetical protein
MADTTRLKSVAAFATAFAVDTGLYLALLLMIKTALEHGIKNAWLVGLVVGNCMLCSITGLAVLRAFSFRWSRSVLAIYLTGGLVMLAALTLLANVIGGDGTVIRGEVLVAVTVLQWVAFAMPAMFYAKQLLARPDSI